MHSDPSVVGAGFIGLPGDLGADDMGAHAQKVCRDQRLKILESEMGEFLVGFDFVQSTWQFTHVEFSGTEVESIGLAMETKETTVCLRMSPADARHIAESILGILGE